VGLKYVHVGAGRTLSRFYCPDCDGYYGIPHRTAVGGVHDGHPWAVGCRPEQCACRACQEHLGIFPNQGVWMSREEIDTMIASGVIPVLPVRRAG
jgi:hypothetical protein